MPVRVVLITLSSVTSTEQARRKYDEIADRYEEIFFYVAGAGQRLVTFADPAPGSRALDVGAGRGAVARAALGVGCAVTAIDASPRMMERLGSDYPSITTLVMDAASLDFPDGSFDLVTAGFVVQVLPDPAAVLAEMHRVLAPGGTVALSLETQSPGRLAWLHELSAEFFGGASSAGSGPLAQDQLNVLLAGAGFLDVATESVAMPLPIADPPALWDWLAPRGLGDAMHRLPPERAADFHRRFVAEAERMHESGGITLDFAATLHRATRGPSPA